MKRIVLSLIVVLALAAVFYAYRLHPPKQAVTVYHLSDGSRCFQTYGGSWFWSNSNGSAGASDWVRSPRNPWSTPGVHIQTADDEKMMIVGIAISREGVSRVTAQMEAGSAPLQTSSSRAGSSSALPAAKNGDGKAN